MPTGVAGLAIPTPWPASANWQTVLEYGVSIAARKLSPAWRSRESSRLREPSSAFRTIMSRAIRCGKSSCSRRANPCAAGKTATARKLANRCPRNPSSSDSSATTARSSSPDTTISRKVLESRICKYSGVSG
ncbi:hypothetical protein G6F31_017473 [Rhizopus arrhizus]|nr:hypothetical protein G6F31_017473 [Rhizopus arrhizus]